MASTVTSQKADQNAGNEFIKWLAQNARTIDGSIFNHSIRYKHVRSIQNYFHLRLSAEHCKHKLEF